MNLWDALMGLSGSDWIIRKRDQKLFVPRKDGIYVSRDGEALTHSIVLDILWGDTLEYCVCEKLEIEQFAELGGFKSNLKKADEPALLFLLRHT